MHSHTHTHTRRFDTDFWYIHKVTYTYTQWRTPNHHTKVSLSLSHTHHIKVTDFFKFTVYFHIAQYMKCSSLVQVNNQSDCIIVKATKWFGPTGEGALSCTATQHCSLSQFFNACSAKLSWTAMQQDLLRHFTVNWITESVYNPSATHGRRGYVVNVSCRFDHTFSAPSNKSYCGTYFQETRCNKIWELTARAQHLPSNFK